MSRTIFSYILLLRFTVLICIVIFLSSVAKKLHSIYFDIYLTKDKYLKYLSFKYTDIFENQYFTQATVSSLILDIS